MDETELDVDLRPRSPVDERRYEERGVSGAGERERRCCCGVVTRDRGMTGGLDDCFWEAVGIEPW